MSDPTTGFPASQSTGEAIGNSVRRVAEGVSDAVGQARQAANQAGDGIGELRKVIRGQPLTMWFLAIGMGYLLGHLAGRAPGR